MKLTNILSELLLTLKDILNESDTDPDKVFGNIAFGSYEYPEKDHYDMAKKIARLQGKTPDEENTKTENEILNALLDWVFSTNVSPISDRIYKHRSLFKKASAKFPSIFKPNTPNGTKVYRGVNLSETTLNKLAKSLAIRDNVKTLLKYVKLDGSDYLYVDVPIEYTPHNNVQSWTTSKKVAKKFFEGVDAPAILVSKQNDEYVFNQKVMNILYTSHPKSLVTQKPEDEILHFGKKYSEDIFVLLRGRAATELVLKVYALQQARDRTNT